MNVIKTGTMPDGTPIQIEDWHMNYPFVPCNSTVAAYPKSKANHTGSFSPKCGEKFRAQFDFESTEDALTVFKNLVSGQKTLADYKDKFYSRHKYSDCI